MAGRDIASLFQPILDRHNRARLTFNDFRVIGRETLRGAGHMRRMGFIPAGVVAVLMVFGAVGPSHADSCFAVQVANPAKMAPGTTAIMDNSGSYSRILECDAQGRILWEYEFPSEIRTRYKYANDLEWLPASNHFLFSVKDKGIFEVSRDKEIVWSYKVAKVSHDADRLPGGNTIFVYGGGDTQDDMQVTEISPKGEIVWSWKAADHLADEQRFDPPAGRKELYSYTHANAVIRLPSGNTIVSVRNFNMVVEVTPDGKIVRKIRDLRRVHDPFLLPNGNFMVSLLYKLTYVPIREVTPTGDIVWEYSQPDLASVTTVDVLSNGNILVAGRNMIVEVTRDKEVVWQAVQTNVDIDVSEQAQHHLYKVVRIPPR